MPKLRLRRLAVLAVGAAVAAIAAGIGTGRIPARPILTFIQFKFAPEKARVQHLVQLRHPESGQVVFLAGTTHQYHYDDPAYSIWHVKAIVTGLDVDAVFVEMMPDAVSEARYGEGPVEMPFITLAAREAGIDVKGIDAGWDGGWRGRQAQMFANAQANMAGRKRVLVTSGFMHVHQFEEQFQSVGFVPVPWPEAERQRLFEREVPHTWPVGLADALREAIARAERGEIETDPKRAADTAWFIQVREQVLKVMGERLR